MDAVEYRIIPGLPNHRVGSDGSVWGRGRWHRSATKWCQMKASKSGGYPAIRVCGYTYRVHYLVLLAFVGPTPEGMEGCHNDGDRANNALNNLRWDTHKENAADSIKHGTHPRGERSPHAKLNVDKVRAIRTEYAAGGTSQDKLAKKYGVSFISIWRVINRVRWAHVD